VDAKKRLVWLITFIQHKDFVQAFELATRLVQLSLPARQLTKDIATHFNLLDSREFRCQVVVALSNAW
jgi:hypothetical protein